MKTFGAICVAIFIAACIGLISGVVFYGLFNLVGIHATIAQVIVVAMFISASSSSSTSRSK